LQSLWQQAVHAPQLTTASAQQAVLSSLQDGLELQQIAAETAKQMHHFLQQYLQASA
jgi:hypothetical protein